MSKKPSSRPLLTSPSRRLLKLGGLVGRVGASLAVDRAAGLARSGPVQEAKRAENLVRNAVRVVEALGEMKGAAMKVGQMLSLHEGFLPEEVAQVLTLLQREAPRVPQEVMRYEIEGSLGAPIDEVFAEFDPEAHAAASIGQVYRARLHDGRPVAVKAQYPLIREVVEADLKNLKTLFKRLFAMVFDADFEPLWGEMRDRLREELDYEHEARNMRELRALHWDVPEIVIPSVIDELSSSRLLTMELLEGISPDEACSPAASAELRNRWGRVLFEFQMRGLFEHRLLHADPNLANFSFLDDGRVIVYDFGSVKRVSKPLAEGYSRLFLAALEDRRAKIPAAMAALGLVRANGEPLALELIDPYIDLFAQILRPEPPYEFGADADLYDKLMDLGMTNFSHATDLHFPKDIIFIHRSLAGHFGNLVRLRASGPWRRLLELYARSTRSRGKKAEVSTAGREA